MASESIFLDEGIQPIIPDLSDVRAALSLDSSRDGFEDPKLHGVLEDITNSLDKSKISLRKSFDEQDITTFRSSPYELERKAQIRRNTDFLRKLGVNIQEAQESMAIHLLCFFNYFRQ